MSASLYEGRPGFQPGRAVRKIVIEGSGWAGFHRAEKWPKGCNTGEKPDIRIMTMVIGISIGIGVGAVFGAAIDNVPIGIAVGIAVGAGIGGACTAGRDDRDD